MLKEFKEFAMKGNVLDMAIGIIIGAAFGKIVTSFETPAGGAPGRANHQGLPPLPVEHSDQGYAVRALHIRSEGSIKHGASVQGLWLTNRSKLTQGVLR